MAVPKFFEFFKGFLIAVEDGKLHSAKEVREIIATEPSPCVFSIYEKCEYYTQSDTHKNEASNWCWCQDGKCVQFSC